MKNPHPLCNTWTRSINNEPAPITSPETIKKFKRKSREPKRLKTFPSETSDVDMTDDIQTCDISMLAPLQRKLIMSQDMTASAPGILSELPEGSLALAQSTAIDMRIGINLPAIPSKLAQLPASTFPRLEISQWPPAISQPLTNRLKLGLCSPFTLSTSASGSSSSSSHSPGQQEPSMSGQTGTLSGNRAPQISQYHDHMDPQVQSLKVSMCSVHTLRCIYEISMGTTRSQTTNHQLVVVLAVLTPITYTRFQSEDLFCNVLSIIKSHLLVSFIIGRISRKIDLKFLIIMSSDKVS